MVIGWLLVAVLQLCCAHGGQPRPWLLAPLRGGDHVESEALEDDTNDKYIVIGIDGGTESIRACCFDGRTGRQLSKAVALPYETSHPQPGWAEQDPKTWYQNLVQAVRGTVASLSAKEKDAIAAMCIDTTCCSVVALNADGQPLRPCLLWMDQRAAAQTQQIMETCRGDEALRVNGNGEGPLSAEWMVGKALWIAQKERHTVWEQAKTICEYQDYINFCLTGEMVASACNAATRWHWNVEKAVTTTPTVDNPYPGRPCSLYQKLDIPELADKLPSQCLPMGALIGNGLTAQAANDLGLSEGLPVVQGGPDAFVGMIGLGCVSPRQLCLITGSSHLHCVVTDKPRTAAGTWGAYQSAPLPRLNFAEGGQSSTGSLLRWARTLFTNDDDSTALSYADLDAMAAKIPPGADGLIALETFQGQRTPVTDPFAKGALVGLTLSHGKAHIWRALMEAVCLGTRACLEGLAAAGHDCDEVILAGGITRSPLWLQMHADVTGKPVVVCENSDAPMLGCAILAAVGIGMHDASVPTAIKAMVRVAQRVEPAPEAHIVYSRIFTDVYQPMVGKVRDVSHALHSLRGGASRNGKTQDDSDERRSVIISPSLLSADWGRMREEVRRCVEAGATRLHLDIFDGVFLQSPLAFTFGPAMVQIIRESIGKSNVMLDLHMCVHNPARFVDVMAQVAPGATFVFQSEAIPTLTEAMALAQQIVEAGMQCGVSINPSTPIDDIIALLETGLISLVNVLAVEPGFGGQSLQYSALDKVAKLRQWIHERSSLTNILVMVDGGVNEETAAAVRQSGADILVSGSFLFKQDLVKGMQSLLES